MAHDTYADLARGGGSRGPEAMRRPRSPEEAERQERIRLYHEDVAIGGRIRFIRRGTRLAGGRRPRLPDYDTIAAQEERIRALFTL